MDARRTRQSASLQRTLKLCARLRQLMGERGVSRKVAKARPAKIATEPDRRSFRDELAAVIEQSPLALQDKQKLVDHFKRTGKHAADMTLTELRRAREAAGLSLGQAAGLLGMERHTLENIEHGAWNPSAEQLAAMNRVYGLARSTTSAPGIQPATNAAQPQGESLMRSFRLAPALLIAAVAIGLALISSLSPPQHEVNSSHQTPVFDAVYAIIDADTPDAVPANRDAQCVAVDLIDRSDQSAIAEPPCATVDQHAWRPAPNPAPLPGALLLTSQARREIPVALLFDQASPLPQFRQPLLI